MKEWTKVIDLEDYSLKDGEKSKWDNTRVSKRTKIDVSKQMVTNNHPL
jgi:hypothetical protein